MKYGLSRETVLTNFILKTSGECSTQRNLNRKRMSNQRRKNNRKRMINRRRKNNRKKMISQKRDIELVELIKTDRKGGKGEKGGKGGKKKNLAKSQVRKSSQSSNQ